MNFTFIEPGPSNPEGADNGRWKIMIEENGTTRHLNDADDHTSAVIKAEKAAVKRGIEFQGHASEEPEEELEVDPDQPKWLSVPKPKGAPKLGDYVKFNGPDGEKELLVVDYLADQFVGLADGGSRQVVHVSEDWKIS